MDEGKYILVCFEDGDARVYSNTRDGGMHVLEGLARSDSLKLRSCCVSDDLDYLVTLGNLVREDQWRNYPLDVSSEEKAKAASRGLTRRESRYA